MSRPPKDYSKPVPYTPGPPPVFGNNPEEAIRAIWDEFNRIAAVLAQNQGTVPARNREVPAP